MEGYSGKESNKDSKDSKDGMNILGYTALSSTIHNNNKTMINKSMSKTNSMLGNNS